MDKLKAACPLLVENIVMADSIKKMLQGAGYQVSFIKDIASFPEEAGDLPDLLLLEPSLFHWGWMEALIKFQRIYSQIPIIMFSTLSTVDGGFSPLLNTQKIYLANDLNLLKQNLKRIQTSKKEFTKQILFVDDDEKMLNAYGRMLRKSHWKIIKSTSGEKALEVIDNNRIDLIVTDIKMPEMHGMELISKIRIKNKDVPIAVSSGYPGMKEDVSFKYHGIAAFISKPIEESKLYSVLERILEPAPGKKTGV
jgi:DNA-binding NtrC family response regulator